MKGSHEKTSSQFRRIWKGIAALLATGAVYMAYSPLIEALLGYFVMPEIRIGQEELVSYASNLGLTVEEVKSIDLKTANSINLGRDSVIFPVYITNTLNESIQVSDFELFVNNIELDESPHFQIAIRPENKSTISRNYLPISITNQGVHDYKGLNITFINNNGYDLAQYYDCDLSINLDIKAGETVNINILNTSNLKQYPEKGEEISIVPQVTNSDVRTENISLQWWRASLLSDGYSYGGWGLADTIIYGISINSREKEFYFSTEAENIDVNTVIQAKSIQQLPFCLYSDQSCEFDYYFVFHFTNGKSVTTSQYHTQIFVPTADPFETLFGTSKYIDPTQTINASDDIVHSMQYKFFPFDSQLSSTNNDEEIVENAEEDATYTEWQQAYISYINKNRGQYGLYRDDDKTRYSLINVNDDDIPELYINYGSTAEGDIICTYNNGAINEQVMWNNGFSYLPEQNLFRDSGGHMGNFYDKIYIIDEGEFILMYSGSYELFETVSDYHEADEGPIIHGYWEGQEVFSLEEYMGLLNNYYDTQQSVSPYFEEFSSSTPNGDVRKGLCTYEEIIEAINYYYDWNRL